MSRWYEDKERNGIVFLKIPNKGKIVIEFKDGKMVEQEIVFKQFAYKLPPEHKKIVRVTIV